MLRRGRSSERHRLVEIVDDAFARMVSEQCRLQAYLEETTTTRVAFNAKFADALIFVRYFDEFHARERRRLAPLLLERLEDLPERFDGFVELPRDAVWAAGLRVVRVSRGSFVGPAFQVDATAFLANPIVERLEGKCRKAYSGSAPIELLAYFELQPTVAEVWRDRVVGCIAENLSESPFRRVWVYDANTKSVLFESALRSGR